MSKMTTAAVKSQMNKALCLDKVVKNFDGGDSYIVNPLDTLKMISASSIFGEPSYYRDSNISGTRYSARGRELLEGFFAVPEEYLDETTETVMTKAIDNALSYGFKGTLDWAVELRNNYYIRLNPQIILARAAMHPGREEFTKSSPDGTFRKYASEIMRRPDDVMSGMAYYMYANGDKAKMPSVLKRSYADKLSGLSAYQVNKYKNAEIGMINAVRICHANSPVLNELMRTGTVQVEEDQNTWEHLRSAGKSWEEIFKTINMGHMAMLRNLRGFFSEVNDYQILEAYLEKLIDGVPSGKQFPFRYYSAYNAVENSDLESKKKVMIMDALEFCVDKAIENMPKMHGNVAVLSDNSGSAWGTIPSEYGSVTIAEIGNLSAVLTAANSDYGEVIAFGDTMMRFPISKKTGLLKQAKDISDRASHEVGQSTECGIWLFFDSAIQNKEHWDSIFIYSDQQAGHGGLYGTRDEAKRYHAKYGISGSYTSFINVFKLVLDYRKLVNKKVNVFSIQTAGYDNNVLPEYAYRTNIMYGWTGKECVFADTMIKLWDSIEKHS